jgi:hypothetical protein
MNLYLESQNQDFVPDRAYSDDESDDSDEENQTSFRPYGGLRGAEEVDEGDDDDDDVFALANALKGKTTGRRIKRCIFKFGLYQLFFGIALMGIAGWETTHYPLDGGWFSEVKYGSSVRNLTWVVAFPTCLMGVLGMVAIRYWASLVS